MGGRQLSRRGQLRVDEAHHHVRRPLEGVREQRPPFAVVPAAFWVWPWRPRCLIASQFWTERLAWGRSCYKRFCKRQAADRRH
jgi:hypothetical protein